MIKSAVVAAVFGFCDSIARRPGTVDAATLATLRSKWSAL